MILQIAANKATEIASGFIDFNTGCVIIITVLSGVVVYLYKRLEAKNELFITELRNSNAQLTNVCTSYNKFVDKMDRIIEVMSEKK